MPHRTETGSTVYRIVPARTAAVTGPVTVVIGLVVVFSDAWRCRTSTIRYVPVTRSSIRTRSIRWARANGSCANIRSTLALSVPSTIIVAPL